MRISGTITFDIQITEDIPQPKPIAFTIKREFDMLNFTVDLPDDFNGQKFGGQVTITVGDNLPVLAATTKPGDTSAAGTLDVPAAVGNPVRVEFRYVDTAGNLSQPATADGVVVDITPPPTPGPITFVVSIDADA